MKKSNIKKIIKSILKEVIQETDPATKGLLASKRDEVRISPITFGELLLYLHLDGIELKEEQQIKLFRQTTKPVSATENVGLSHGVIGGHPVKMERDPLNEIRTDLKKATRIANKMWGSVYNVNFHGEKQGELHYKATLHSPTGPIKWIKNAPNGKWYVQSANMRWELYPKFHPIGRVLENPTN